MSATGWELVELTSGLLERHEREAVLGDLVERREGTWPGLCEVLGLVARRQAGLWRDGRPWLAGFVVAVPCSYLLMIVSLSVTCTYDRLFHHRAYWHWPTGHEGYLLWSCHIALLIVWSWTAGYVVGMVSRRTLWASVALCAYPCINFAVDFPYDFLPRLCLFLFLPPAVLGARRALRSGPIGLAPAFLLAVSTTGLMAYAWMNEALWDPNWLLAWPAWYLVSTAEHSEGHSGRVWRAEAGGATV